MHFLYKYLLLTLVMVLLSAKGLVFAQFAPQSTLTTVMASNPGAIQVPLNVTGATNIMALTLRIEYNPAVLTFSGIANSDPGLTGLLVNAVPVNDQLWKIMIIWSSFNALTIGSNGTGKLLDLEFNYLQGNTTLAFNNEANGGSDCEWTGPDLLILIDIPTETYYLDGFVCGMVGPAGPISGQDTLCESTPSVTYGVEPIANANLYTWTIPDDFLLLNGQGTPTIEVQAPYGEQSGMISVYGSNECGNGSSSEMMVSVIPLPLVIGVGFVQVMYGIPITLYAPNGGPYIYSYHWQPEEYFVDPFVQNPQTVPLVNSIVVSETVTDLLHGCVNGGFAIIQVNGGPVEVQPSLLPDLICEGDSAQLFANASGGYGSGYYTYSWACQPPGNPPWSSSMANPLVSPDISTLYEVTVTDGLTSASGSVLLSVTPRPEQPVITLNEGYLISSAPDGNQWYNQDGPVSGAVTQVFLPEVNGYYHVVVSLGDCSSLQSNVIYYDLVGISLIDNGLIQIFPNPAHDFITITGTFPGQKELTITMYDMTGRMILKRTHVLSDGNLFYRIETIDLFPEFIP